MYAIIATGGKQYRVKEGEKLRVEKLSAEAGDTVELDKVLMIGEGDDVKVGAPYLDGAKVTATVAANGRGDKVKIIHTAYEDEERFAEIITIDKKATLMFGILEHYLVEFSPQNLCWFYPEDVMKV